MIGESTEALLLIKSSIFAIRAITPLSFLYWALVLLSPLLPYFAPALDLGLFSWSSRSITVWAIRIFTGNEVWFYFWSQTKIKTYQAVGDYDPGKELSKQDRQELFDRILNSIDDPRKFISGWFFGASPEEVYRDNMVEWILWAFFNQHSREQYDDDVTEMKLEVDKFIEAWEHAIGVKTKPGYNHAVKCIRLNSDPVKTIHRPACVYIGVGVLYDFLGWWRYYSLGLRHYIPSAASGHRIQYPYIGLPSRPSNSVLTYWYRPRPALKSGEKEELPLVFIHGIGAGLKIYRDMITKFSTDNPRSAIYLLEMPPVTMKFTQRLPRKQEYVDAVAALLHSNGHAEALFLGHSLGTVIASWIIHLQPKLCRRVILIDPVCFLLHLPDVAFNFLHRPPTNANHWLYWFFVSNEPGIAWFLGRGFYWSENILWTDQLPSSRDGTDEVKTTVFLSEDDMIVDIPSVWSYLTETSIPPLQTDGKPGDKLVHLSTTATTPNVRRHRTVLWRGPGMDHAMFLLMRGPSRDIVTTVHQQVQECV